MTFTATRPVPKSIVGSGISVYMRRRKDGKGVLTFTLSAQFQEDNFDGNIEGEFIQFSYGSGPDTGTARLSIVDEKHSTIVAIKSMKGAVRFSCLAWTASGKEPQKSAQCQLLDNDKCTLLLKLPDWANGKEKLKSQFDIKPSGAAT